MTSPTTINPTALPSLPLDERRELPDTAAIYFVLAGDTVLYIGQSVNVRQRWLAHHRLAQLNEHGGCRIAWMTVDGVSLLNELEQACIAHFQPALNGTNMPGWSPLMGCEKENAPDLSWRTMLRLTPQAAEEVERLAARDATPAATVCRRLVMERLEQLRREGQLGTPS